VFEKPFSLDALEDLLQPCAGEGDGEVVTVPTLDEIIASADLNPHFQPIIDLRRGGVFAFESLARLATRSPFSNPELLFDYATQKLRVADLELACMKSTFRTAPAVSAGRLLFMNLHPAALSACDRLCDLLLQQSAASGFPLRQVVLELTEQHQLPDDVQTHESVSRMRALGVRFAFDDVGMAYSHLPLIDRIRPEFLKISQHFGTAFESDPSRSKLVANLFSLARDFDASLILEGIESAETDAAARALGIPLGQGYLYSRPLPSAAAAAYASRAAVTTAASLRD
jgi:EAL domain-containing protein (putative c-di-GMP-specific phosphodiesterase class I)